MRHLVKRRERKKRHATYSTTDRKHDTHDRKYKTTTKKYIETYQMAEEKEPNKLQMMTCSKGGPERVHERKEKARKIKYMEW